MKTLNESVDRLKIMADQLIPYSYPKTSHEIQKKLILLKQEFIMVDGHQIIVHFNKSDYGNYFVETLKLKSKNGSFVPFSVMMKVVIRFLGSHELSLMEYVKNDKKLYFWTVYLNTRGCPLPIEGDNITKHTYEGINYKKMDSSQANLLW